MNQFVHANTNKIAVLVVKLPENIICSGPTVWMEGYL
jgi:hypothetical protein